MNATAQTTLAKVQQFAATHDYIAVRDNLWRDLKEELYPSAYAVGVLEFANRIVTILLNAEVESTSRSLALLRCRTCEVFVLATQREIRARRPLPVKIDIPFMRGSLALALSAEGTIPPPTPSDSSPTHQTSDDLQPPVL